MTQLRWHVTAGLLLAAALALAAPTSATACTHFCPFCSEERGPTLVEDFLQASFVIYGTFTNSKIDPKVIEGGTSDFAIEKILKNHSAVNGKDKLELPKYVPPMQAKNKWVVFCDVFNGVVNPYKGIEAQSGGDLLNYLNSSIGVKDQPIGKRLRHCFDFLDSADQNVSLDAYREYAKADYLDYKDIAKTLPAEKIAGWLQDPKSPAYRYGLYGSLLGHCGESKKHGDLLRAMIDDPKTRMGPGIDGLVAGYVLLQPKEAFAFLQEVLKNQNEEFPMRYAALRTLRFFWENRTDVLAKDNILQGMALVIATPDIADFGIDDLRLWKQWQMTDKVLDLFDKETHNHPVVRRSILRFALTSPSARAATFVKDQRKRDAAWVSDAEEMLRFEEPALKVEPKKK